MTPYQWFLAAGALGTFVIIWQNWLSFRDTRIDLENRLRERLKGRGGKRGKIGVSVDEIRIYELSRLAKLKWYSGFGVDSGVEVKIETNMNLDEEVWKKIEEGFNQMEIGFPVVEFLGTQDFSDGQTFLSILRVNSTDESEIMAVVCAIPIIVNQMDLDYELQKPPSAMLFDLPDEYEDKLADTKTPDLR